MSDLEMNLSVVTEYLGELAAKQQTAVDIITTANSHVADIASKIENTHGQVCFATVHALSGNEPRKAAGQALATVSALITTTMPIIARAYQLEKASIHW